MRAKIRLCLICCVAITGAADAEPWRPRFLRDRVARGPADEAETSDWLLATRARSALWNDKSLASLSIEVTVRQGVATLYGPVPSDQLRRQAGEVVERVPGVKRVRNQLRVENAQPKPPHRPSIFPPADELPPAKQPERPLPPRPRQRSNDPLKPKLAGQPRADNDSKPPTEQPKQPTEWQWRPLEKKAPAPAKPSNPGGATLLPPVVEPQAQ